MKFLFVLGVLSALASRVSSSVSCSVADSSKTDCGYVGIDQYGCEAKGCCWAPSSQGGSTPWCFHGSVQSSGYSLSNLVESATGLIADLTLIGSGTSTYGSDLKNLRLEVVYENEDVVRVKITDRNNVRWEVPDSVIPRKHASVKPASTNFKFSYTESPFTFEITRVDDGRSLFKLADSFKFKDQYLEITTSIDGNAKTFGLGESTRLNHALKPKTYT